jgi:hypothetical protein
MTSQDDESGCGGGGIVTVDGAESIGKCGRMKMDDQTIRYLWEFYRIPYPRANLYYSNSESIAFAVLCIVCRFRNEIS